MRYDRLLAAIVGAQILLGLRVFARFLGSTGGQTIRARETPLATNERVAVVVPVLNELDRLGPCLEGLLRQSPEVGEILVVDSGSDDGTPEFVRHYCARDTRLRLVDAGPIPDDWNGKAWGLQVGVRQADPRATWILMVDADVRPAPLLARSLLAHAQQTALAVLSVATRQAIRSPGEGLVHPAMLTTLVYRFGLPGGASRRVSQIQANGQCFLVRRDVLVRSNALFVARASRCEDVTIARCLATAGWAVGFYETDELAWVKMYENWHETWHNWPRSLPMRDQYCRLASITGLAEVTLVQALPLPLVLLFLAVPRLSQGPSRWMLATDVVLTITRVGVLCGAARAYRHVPWSYWLSPLCDLPVSLRLWVSAFQRRHTWRGRVLVSGGTN